jgi:hypothetical protein
MITFNAAPSVPRSYTRLSSALSRQEIEEAVRLGYVAEHTEPSEPVHNEKAFNVQSRSGPGLDDWPNRLFLVWFCYLFENLGVVQRPLAAIEEIILELGGGPADLDAGVPRLASLYAGAAAREPLSSAELAREREFLEPYYRNALELVGARQS